MSLLFCCSSLSWVWLSRFRWRDGEAGGISAWLRASAGGEAPSTFAWFSLIPVRLVDSTWKVGVGRVLEKCSARAGSPLVGGLTHSGDGGVLLQRGLWSPTSSGWRFSSLLTAPDPLIPRSFLQPQERRWASFMLSRGKGNWDVDSSVSSFPGPPQSLLPLLARATSTETLQKLLQRSSQWSLSSHFSSHGEKTESPLIRSTLRLAALMSAPHIP